MGKICKYESCDVELTEETRYKDRALCTTHGKAMMRAQSAYRQLNDRKYYMNKMWCALRQRSTKSDMGSSAYGKEYLSQEEFWDWYENETKEIFEAMFQAYKDSGFDRTLAPSVDRIDASEGYQRTNIQWLTLSDNAAKGNRELQPHDGLYP